MQVDVLILFGLEKRDGMYLEFAECGRIKSIKQLMQRAVEILVIQSGNELCNFLLCDAAAIILRVPSAVCVMPRIEIGPVRTLNSTETPQPRLP